MRRFPFVPLCLSSFVLTVAVTLPMASLPTVAKAAPPQPTSVHARG